MSPEITLVPEFTSEIVVEHIVSCGGDWLVCDAARNSTRHSPGAGERQITTPADIGLINSLVEKRHGGPFMHGCLTMYVEAPIFVMREWRTHKIVMYQDEQEYSMLSSFSDDMGHSEASARYRPLAPKFWIPRETRPMIVPDGHKAMAPRYELADPHNYACIIASKKRAHECAWREFTKMITIDRCAPEVARGVLGTSIYSSMYVTCNPRSLLHFLSLRIHAPEALFVSYPQAEIEEAAIQAEEFLRLGWPTVHEKFVANGRVGP